MVFLTKEVSLAQHLSDQSNANMSPKYHKMNIILTAPLEDKNFMSKALSINCKIHKFQPKALSTRHQSNNPNSMYIRNSQATLFLTEKNRDCTYTSTLSQKQH